MFPAVVISIIAIFTTSDHLGLIVWNSLGLIFGLYIRYVYGPGDLSRVEIRGQYEVGHRQYHVDKSENAVSVYYPVDA